MNNNTQYPRPKYIQRNLLGCLETALFMRKGADRFSISPQGMKRSFIVPFTVLPLSAATLIAAHPDTLSTESTNMLIAIYALRTVLYLAAFMGFSYLLAKSLDRMEEFYRFVTASNWLVVPAAAVMLPLSVSFFAGFHAWADIYPMMVFITLYSYACMAFMAMHVMRLPRELAAFVAIASMALNESALDIVQWASVQALHVLA